MLLNDHRKETASYFGADGIISGRNRWNKTGKYAPFRSGLEKMYAEYLDSVDRKYEYEKQAFQIITDDGIKLHYIPDFYLPDCNKFIEIISHTNYRNMYKAILFREQYPGENLVVYEKKDILRICG